MSQMVQRERNAVQLHDLIDWVINTPEEIPSVNQVSSTVAARMDMVLKQFVDHPASAGTCSVFCQVLVENSIFILSL